MVHIPSQFWMLLHSIFQECAHVTLVKFNDHIFLMTDNKTFASFLQSVQSFAAEHLKTPLGEPVKGKKKKSGTELWVEKFYKKTTNLPEPFPHELVERLEEYLDVRLFFSCYLLCLRYVLLSLMLMSQLQQKLEEKLVDLSSLLYDHQLEDAYQNSSDILQSTIFTQQ